MTMTSSLHDSARSGASGNAWEFAARAAYAVSGVLHLMLGFLIARIGVGGDGEASQSTVLETLGDSAFGTAALWIAVVAFLALAAWQVADAFQGGKEAKDRAKAAGKCVLYLALALTAGRIAVGAGDSGDGDEQAQGLASSLMDVPAGRILVGAVGVGIIAGAVYHGWKGLTKKFLEDLRALPSGTAKSVVTWVGIVGYVAKGVALAVVGVLFTAAAITYDAKTAQGIDGAIDTLKDAPAGPAVVVVVGLGFAAYGLYSFARARYARM